MITADRPVDNITIDCEAKKNITLMKLHHHRVNEVFQRESSNLLCTNYVTSVTSTNAVTEWPHKFYVSFESL